MIDEMDLVNMNGRVYDPTLGRFLSADPFIHDVTNSQDLNRYSYVHNNPLSFTDMNGYGFFKSIGKFFKKFWKPLLAIIVAIVAIHLGPLLFGEAAGTALVGAESTLTFGQSAIISGISGGLSNVVLTGRPKAFLTGFGQAFATFGVGHGIFKGGAAFGSAKWAGKAVAHGVVGGAFAEIRGGSFKSGFLAAGFSSAVAPLAPSGNIWAGAAFSAAAGGAGSVLGGGKFADGAVTGAFQYMFNEALSPRVVTLAQRKAAEQLAIDALEPYVPLTVKSHYEYYVYVTIRGPSFWDRLLGRGGVTFDVSPVYRSDHPVEEGSTRIPLPRTALIIGHTHPFSAVPSGIDWRSAAFVYGAGQEMVIVGPGGASATINGGDGVTNQYTLESETGAPLRSDLPFRDQ